MTEPHDTSQTRHIFMGMKYDEHNITYEQIQCAPHTGLQLRQQATPRTLLNITETSCHMG